MEPPQPQDLCELALRVWLTRLPAMQASWLPGGNDEADQLQLLEEMMESPAPQRVVAASHGLSVQHARARAVARLATLSRACRALAEATLPAPVRAPLKSKEIVLTGLVLEANRIGVLDDVAVQDALVALHAAGVAPPAVRDTRRGADEAARWYDFANAAEPDIRAMRTVLSDPLADLVMERAARPLGQGPVDRAVTIQAHRARFLTLLSGAAGEGDAAAHD